jgi:hypothetical protein
MEDIVSKNYELQYDLQLIANKHKVSMEWIDLVHLKGRFDDIMAVFRKRPST